MNINTIIKLLDELRRSAYREGHFDAQIDADYNNGDLTEEDMDYLITEGDALEGITDGVYEEIINALHQLSSTPPQITDPFGFVSTSTIEDVDLEN